VDLAPTRAEMSNSSSTVFDANYWGGLAGPRAQFRHYTQHWTCNHLFGDFIPAEIVKGRKGLKVADLGCGNGVLIVELSENWADPTAAFVGYDVSPIFFPPPDWLPSNVKLVEKNILQDFPPEVLGTFDIVVARYLTTVFIGDSEKTAATLFANVSALLKPGGHFVYVEAARFADWGPRTLKEGLETGGMKEIASRWPLRDLPDSTFAALEERYNLRPISHEDRPLPSSLWHGWTAVSLSFFEDIVSRLPTKAEQEMAWSKAGKEGPQTTMGRDGPVRELNKEEGLALLAQAGKESREGVALTFGGFWRLIVEKV